MKHILSISLFLMALVTVFSCVDDLKLGADYGIEDFDEGELTECKINVEVTDFGVSTTTRTANPDTTANNTASDQEKAIDNIWVFQYNTSGNALVKPRYYHKAESADDNYNWSVLLKEDEESTIYVVANTGDSTWASSLDDFFTLTKLKKKTLPDPEPIDSTKTPNFFIPMQGYVQNKTVNLYDSIKVPVERMYAKLIISTKMPKTTKTDTITLKSIMVSNIPLTCWVESKSCGDEKADSTAEKTGIEYPDTFSVWSVQPTNTTGIAATESGDTTTGGKKLVKQPDYVLYVPENIRGEVDANSVNKLRGIGIPSRAMTVQYGYKVAIGQDKDHPDKDVEGGNTEGTITVYPGTNTTNNFNVKRNRIYKITATVNSTEFFAPSASANCMIVVPGDSLVFWPYYRLETGGGYNIKNYLDPTDTDLAIDTVKIIWQDKDVIGDNSNGKLVTCSTLTTKDVPKDSDSYTYLRNRFKIRVKVSEVEGNALIGGYNSKGEIIWSWHIWVTKNDPANVGNAEYFTTYDWDASGIKYDKDRIVGYRIMACNLGAKESEPEGGDPTVTYGLLYQWGRKDPFPSMKRTTTGSKKTTGFVNYSYESSESNIQIYDNSNHQIYLSGTGWTDERAYSDEDLTTVLYDGEASDRQYLFGTVKTSDTKTKGGIKFSINHPTTFIAAANTKFTAGTKTYNGYKYNDYNYPNNYDNDGDWLLGHDDGLWGGDRVEDGTIKHRKVNNIYFKFWNDDKTTISDIWPWMWNNYGDEKTIFDPSPKGWRVPPQDFWIGFTSIGECVNQYRMKEIYNYGESQTDLSFAKFIDMVNSADAKKDISNNNGIHLYLSVWKNGEKSFFPCPGTRLASGQPQHLGTCGNYHCASAAPLCTEENGTHTITLNQRVNCFHIHADPTEKYYQVNPFECQRLYVCKAIAGPIRCVLDTK